MRRIALAATVVGVFVTTSPPAHADEAPAGIDPVAQEQAARSDRRRLAHLGAMAGAGALYLGIQFGLEDVLVPEQCRWCEPGSFDDGMRNALVWDDTDLAHQLSNATGYVGAPLVAVGALAWAAKDRGWRRWFDDSAAVLESAIAASLFHHAVKYSVGRQRPRIHYGTRPPGDGEDNMSFFSGHTSLAFSLAVASGRVASLHGYRAAPAIWASGLVLASATAYLRVGADAHYTSDVLVGAAVGAAFGYLLPPVLACDTLRQHDLAVVPSGRGLALTGSF